MWIFRVDGQEMGRDGEDSWLAGLLPMATSEIGFRELPRPIRLSTPKIGSAIVLRIRGNSMVEEMNPISVAV